MKFLLHIIKMKNIFLYLFLLLSQLFFAQNSFEKGNALYQESKYEQAAQEYENIVNVEKKQSAELYYNLGNCYYKLNKVAPAIYYYEKALVLNPNHAEALNNLKFAKKLTIDEIKEVPKVGFAKLIRNFTGIYHYNTWAWISVSIAVVFLLFFIGYYFSQLTRSKRVYFIGMFLILLALLVSLTSGFLEKSHFDNERPAIVFAEIAEVRSEPQKAGSPIFTLHEGAKVYVKQSLQNWKKIELTDGTEGWIEASTVKEVK